LPSAFCPRIRSGAGSLPLKEKISQRVIFAEFADYYNNHRYHFGREKEILERREIIKQRTLMKRRIDFEISKTPLK